MNTMSISIKIKVNMREQIMAHKAAAELHHNEVTELTKHAEENRSGRFNTHDHTQRIKSQHWLAPSRLQVCVYF